MALTAPEAIDIARFLSRIADDKLTTAMPPEPKDDPTALVDRDTHEKIKNLKRPEAWREAGKWLVTYAGCVNCHTVAPGGKALPKRDDIGLKLASIAKLPGKGCIADAETRTPSPKFGFAKEQQDALNAFLAGGLTGAGSPSPIYAAKTALKRFNWRWSTIPT